jgi:hypothetical protein
VRAFKDVAADLGPAMRKHFSKVGSAETLPVLMLHTVFGQVPASLRTLQVSLIKTMLQHSSRPDSHLSKELTCTTVERSMTCDCPCSSQAAGQGTGGQVQGWAGSCALVALIVKLGRKHYLFVAR